MNLIVKSFVAGAAALIAVACNTVEGVGQDVEEVGDEIEETANEARQRSHQACSADECVPCRFKLARLAGKLPGGPSLRLARAKMKLTVLINPLSGSVPVEAESELVAVAEETGIELNIVMAQADKLNATLEVYAKGGEDVLAVWGGDGTIACALETVGRDGPPILPLPGGTMNLLHRRVHGVPDGDAIDWRSCLAGALKAGRVETISAGLIDGERRFYVGALFGELAGLSRAREAIREGRPMEAAEKVGDAGAFDLATSLAFHEIQGEDIGMQGEATALAAFVPATGGDRLEIGWIDPDNLAQLAGVGVEIALGDWRSASGVEYKRWEALRIFHAHEDMMEATLDGEPIRLRSGILVGMESEAARVLAAPGT